MRWLVEVNMDIWHFALVNGKLAEVFYDKKQGKKKYFGHCYVKSEDYKTKKEQKWIKEDTAKYKFSYRNKTYKDLIRKLEIA